MPDFWGKFNGVMNGLAFNLFFQQEITWHRLIEGIDYHGENRAPEYQEIQLKCLVGYNDFRTWPMDRVNESGSIDMQNMYIILNKKYLEEEGYINDNGYFNFSSQKDFFSLKGIYYEDSGDTEVSQSADDNLFFYIILKRKEYETGEKVHGWP